MKAITLPVYNVKISRLVNKTMYEALDEITARIASNPDVTYENDDVVYKLGVLDDMYKEGLDDEEKEEQENNLIEDKSELATNIKYEGTLNIQGFCYSRFNAMSKFNDHPEVRSLLDLDIRDANANINAYAFKKFQDYVINSSLHQPTVVGITGMYSSNDEQQITKTLHIRKSGYQCFNNEDIDGVVYITTFQTDDSLTIENPIQLSLHRLYSLGNGNIELRLFKTSYISMSSIKTGGYPIYKLDDKGLINFDEPPIYLSKKFIFTLTRCLLDIKCKICPKTNIFKNIIDQIEVNSAGAYNVASRILGVCDMDCDADAAAGKYKHQASSQELSDLISKQLGGYKIDRYELFREYGYTKTIRGTQLTPYDWLVGNILSKLDLFNMFNDLECDNDIDRASANLMFFKVYRDKLNIKICDKRESEMVNDINSMSEYEVEEF